MRNAGTMTARQVVDTISNTLSLVDERLSDHGVRVANLVLHVLKQSGGYSGAQMRDICLAALVHDIGAFKTEEVEKIIHFETGDVWAHSVFGHVFMKELSPLARLAPAVFFHHADLEWLERLHPSYHDIAQILHIADRADVLRLGGERLDAPAFDRFFSRHRDRLFRGDLIDSFRDAVFGAAGGGDGFRDMLAGMEFTRDETAAYLNMIVLAIDFRSSQTVTHTLATIGIAKTLAELMGLPEDDVGRIVLGATLHDLGKQGTPLSILESTGRLDGREMAIMRNHVVLSNDILLGGVDDEVRLIAVRHHEKLDGSGYPDGLAAADLTLPQRLLAVADILSALMGVRSYKDAFPKEKVLGIIGAEKDAGKIDPLVVDCARDNYERLRVAVEEISASTLAMYGRVRDEYAALKEMVYGGGKGGGMLVSLPLAW